ncbi:MAG: peptidoglycan-binding domain-containing protein, partial [Jannaschia sp.]
MRILIAAVMILIVFLGGPLRAQDGAAWVQIEAHPNLREAEGRARAYGGILNDINGFAIGGGWYALTLGPYSAAEARERLADLRTDGLIPRDSYVSDGRGYRDRFWPLGVAQTPDVAAVPTPLAPTLDTPPAPVTEIEETPREAQRSEALLTRDEKMDLQRALQWFGFYAAAIDGDYGRGTRNSMAAWQRDAGLEATGILTTRQRGQLMGTYRAAQAALGLEPLVQEDAGLSMVAPLGLVTFDRIEAPFVHFLPKGDSGMRLSLISQPGDGAALAGLYEILQTLDVVPAEGPRARERESFSIRGEARGQTTQVTVRLEEGHIFGYMLTWPAAQDVSAVRALDAMNETMMRVGPPLD